MDMVTVGPLAYLDALRDTYSLSVYIVCIYRVSIQTGAAWENPTPRNTSNELSRRSVEGTQTVNSVKLTACLFIVQIATSPFFSSSYFRHLRTRRVSSSSQIFYIFFNFLFLENWELPSEWLANRSTPRVEKRENKTKSVSVSTLLLPGVYIIHRTFFVFIVITEITVYICESTTVYQDCAYAILSFFMHVKIQGNCYL
jgi:hypothetical protein